MAYLAEESHPEGPGLAMGPYVGGAAFAGGRAAPGLDGEMIDAAHSTYLRLFASRSAKCAYAPVITRALIHIVVSAMLKARGRTA